MTKEFVKFEQALALRELGFDEPCFTSYDDEGDLRNPFDYSNSEYDYNRKYIGDTKHFVYNSKLTIENFNGNKDLYTQFIAAPLYQQAFRWLYQKLDIEKGVMPLDTYEEAQLECLKKLIEIVKS